MSIKEMTSHFDDKLQHITNKYGMFLLESSIGLIYIWFGALKFFPGLSPAEKLAGETLSVIVFHSIDQQLLLWGLAIMELIIGISLLFRSRSRIVISLVFLHMAGTLLPFFFFPDLAFNNPPFGFSIIGQYIMKNLVIICALIIIYSKKRS
ncbi:doxx family protein [Maribacter sp. HTCC2170]|uniref:doxx family protein n=1 Tax=Maribacter sp. (strain HTCC2170 / KCCM 42371) TaxID=313603 RepID=UPI0011D2C068|nr:doxx family protein [Maribacter sp. HTCC2170]